MKRIDYAELERATTQAWRNAPNRDNDPVTALQKDAAEISGKLTAFMAQRVDEIRAKIEAGELPASASVIPIKGLTAIFSNEAMSLCCRTADRRATAQAFILTFIEQLHDMLDAYEAAADEEGQRTGNVVFGGRIAVPKVEVPN